MLMMRAGAWREAANRLRPAAALSRLTPTLQQVRSSGNPHCLPGASAHRTILGCLVCRVIKIGSSLFLATLTCQLRAVQLT